jgi:hypothetical protein
MTLDRHNHGTLPQTSAGTRPRTSDWFLTYGDLYALGPERELVYAVFQNWCWYVVGEFVSFRVEADGNLSQTNGERRGGPPLTLEDLDWLDKRLPLCEHCDEPIAWDHEQECPGTPSP